MSEPNGIEPPFSVHAGRSAGRSPYSPLQTALLGEYATADRTYGRREPSVSANSAPREIPTTPSASDRTPGWAISHSNAATKYSSGICTSCGGNSSTPKYASARAAKPRRASRAATCDDQASAPDDPLTTMIAGFGSIEAG